MNGPSQRERFLAILRTAADLPGDPGSAHVADDDELLACWSAGLLEDTEHLRVINHLSRCPACRKQVVEMVRSGALELPDAVDESAPRPRPAQRAERFGSLARLAVAATLLVGAGGVWWYFAASSGPERILAMADRDLRAGRPAVAFDRLAPLVADSAPPEIAEWAKGLFAKAGEGLAARRLAEKNFREVLEIEHQVGMKAEPTAELASLRLQAERGIPARSALCDSGTLLAYGYELDGAALQKDLVLPDATSRRIDKEYREAIDKYPDHGGLRVNAGQFLLSQGRFPEAQREFENALRLEPENAEAELGLGLALFEQRQTRQALESFQRAAEAAPDDPRAHLNAGICLHMLGRVDEARRHWQQALEQTGDAGLRARLEQELKRKDG